MPQEIGGGKLLEVKNFKPGTKIIELGQFNGARDTDGQYGPTKIFDFTLHKTGESVSIFQNASLKQALESGRMDEGGYFDVTFLGEEDSKKGNKWKKLSVARYTAKELAGHGIIVDEVPVVASAANGSDAAEALNSLS